MTTARSIAALTLLTIFFLPTACTTAPTGIAEKQALASDVSAALATLKRADPSLEGLLQAAAGFACFPDVGKAGFIAGGSYGRGEVFSGGKDPAPIGYADVSSGSVGLQAGAQSFIELIVFITPARLEAFKSGSFTFAADASAVVLEAGSAAAARPGDDVIVFVRPRGGLMLEASVGGQKITYVPMTSIEKRGR